MIFYTFFFQNLIMKVPRKNVFIMVRCGITQILHTLREYSFLSRSDSANSAGLNSVFILLSCARACHKTLCSFCRTNSLLYHMHLYRVRSDGFIYDDDDVITMVEDTKKQKICFNGGNLQTALIQQNIKPENLFGIHVPSFKELKQQAENDAWFYMHPVEFKEVGAQQWKLVHPIGSSDYV